MKALVVIDVQNFFTVEDAETLPERIATYIKNSGYDYILFTEMIWDADSNFNKILNWQGPTKSPETDIHAVLQPFVKEDNVFQKTTYSAFKSDEFVWFLKDKDIDSLDICGINIDACVLSTAFEAFDFGYNVHILEDLSSISSSRQEYIDSAKVIIKRNLKSKT